ncbi:MAG: hypothetical protein C5B48_15580, partial [Candidatus Rokuibacteriota bacterium]
MRTPGQSFTRIRAAVGASLCCLVLASTALAAGVTGLHQRSRQLTADERSATMELYVVGSRLEHAREELSSVQARVGAIDGQRRQARLELRAARRTLALAQRRLGSEVRVLYEHDQPDALAVILGSSSLDELLNGLDGLHRAAGATSSVIDQATQARARVARVVAALSVQRQALEQLQAAARARTLELERAQADRRAYLSALRGQAQLTAAQIVSAEAQARAAQATSQTATLEAEASGNVASLAGQSLAP